jgi:hypothetical protein
LPVDDYRPDLEDVGSVILSRTKDQFGNVTGTFSSDTTPNDMQVSALIEKATSRISMKIGTDIPDVCWDDAKTLTALRAAMYVETTYFPEQIVENRSPYTIIKGQYDEEYPEVQLAITRAEDNSNQVLPDQPVLRTSYNFGGFGNGGGDDPYWWLPGGRCC